MALVAPPATRTGRDETRGRARDRGRPGPVLARPPVPATALDLLGRAERGLAVAEAARAPGERYVAAHLAALRCAAAVLAVRGRPSHRGPTNVWAVLPRVAPELAEWSAFFAAGAPRRAAVEAGRPEAVTAREADDLLRDAAAFSGLVAEALGLVPGPGAG